MLLLDVQLMLQTECSAFDCGSNIVRNNIFVSNRDKESSRNRRKIYHTNCFKIGFAKLTLFLSVYQMNYDTISGYCVLIE